MDLMPLRPGGVTVVYGEDVRERHTKAKRILRQLIGSRFANKKNVLIACHPREREHSDFDLSDMVLQYGMLTTDDIREVIRAVDLWETSHVVILGASHYQGKSPYGSGQDGQEMQRSDAALFAQALATSGRFLLVDGPSIGEDGEPYGSMPDLIAIAQSVNPVPDASGLSQFLGHHQSGNGERGAIYIGTGPMFAAKTERLLDVLRARRVEDYLMFKWAQDIRYGGKEKDVTTHSNERFEGEPVHDAYELLAYVLEHGRSKKSIVVTEAQMLAGMDEVAVKLADQGRAVYLDGLIRSFNLMPFGDLPKAACYAAAVDFFPAVCSVCGWTATESQRYKLGEDEEKIVPVGFDDAQVSIGGEKKEGAGSKRYYRSTCLPHLVIPGMPKNPFKLPRYTPRM